MRLYCRIALALLLVYLFEDSVLGAPTKGRYKWVECRPDGRKANCFVKKGPVMELPGPSQRLPPSTVKDIVPVESGEDTPETESEEQSGESSGDLDPLDNLPDRKKDRMHDSPVQVVPQLEEAGLEEEASGEVDYSNFVYPGSVKPKLTEEDLREDNVIQ